MERNGQTTKPDLILSGDPKEKLNEVRFEQVRKGTKFIFAGNYLCYYTPEDDEIKALCLEDRKEKTIQMSKYFDS